MFFSFNLAKEYTRTLHFNDYLLRNRAFTHPLYPYVSEKLIVTFVYGTDIERQLNIWSVPASARAIFLLIAIFMCLAVITLYIIRNKFQLHRNSLLSSIIDTLIAFIAGGNLRIRHNCERWFFAILLIGVFFMTSIFVGDLLDSVYHTMDQKINKLNDLSALSSPIFIHSSLSKHADQTFALSRSVYKHF